MSLPDAIARPWTYEKDPPRGELDLVADTRRETLVEAWAVANAGWRVDPLRPLAIKVGTSLDVLRDSVA